MRFLEFLHRLGEVGVVFEIVARDAETLAQHRNARILHQALVGKLEHRTVRDFLARAALRLAAAHLGQRRLELLKVRILRVEFVERLGHVPRVGDLGQHVGGVRRLLRQLDVVQADALIREAAGLRVARVSEDDLRELEFGFRLRVGTGEAGEIRCLVVARVEAVSVGGLQVSDDRPGARGFDALVEPDRREIAILIERLDRGALLLGGKNSVRFAGQQVAQLLGDRPVGWIERRERVRRNHGLGRTAAGWQRARDGRTLAGGIGTAGCFTGVTAAGAGATGAGAGDCLIAPVVSSAGARSTVAGFGLATGTAA